MNSKLRKALCKIGKHTFDDWMDSLARKGEEFRECKFCNLGFEYRNYKTLKKTIYYSTDKKLKLSRTKQTERTCIDIHGNKIVF